MDGDECGELIRLEGYVGHGEEGLEFGYLVGDSLRTFLFSLIAVLSSFFSFGFILGDR